MNPQSSLGITRMIGRINKTLSFANQVIPLYVKAKPMIANAKSAMNVVKTFMEQTKNNNSNNKTETIKNNNLSSIEKDDIKTPKNNNLPTFFV